VECDALSTDGQQLERLIEDNFAAAARLHFEECADLARGMVPTVRKAYQDIRKGHRKLYLDTLQQIRIEPQFPVLHQRSEDLRHNLSALVGGGGGGGRAQVQTAPTLCELYRHGDFVSGRYDAMLTVVAVKTGATFHAAKCKGLTRVCEKLHFSAVGDGAAWAPQKVTDLVRGALECENFTVMIAVLRLLCDLDTELRVTGETGGMQERICIVRVKDR
jgi:hypothetical protein